MTVNLNTGFADQDYLYEIRQKLLNPMAVKVKSLDDKMSVVEPLAKAAYTHLDVDMDTKEIHFFSDGGGSTVPLNGMFKEGFDLTVQGVNNPPIQKVTTLKFGDATISRGASGLANIDYNWSKLVVDNQVPLQVGTLSDGTKATKHLFFKGAKNVVHTAGDITTVDIAAAATPVTAIIPDKGQTSATPITEIQLSGDVENSNIVGSKLVINLNSGGGVAPIAEDNFKGFFETLGDIESQVKNPINGKSYAFAKDSKLGGAYYTPYFYVSNSWRELKKDPALTYDDPKTPNPQGVFSIKPSEKITIDHLGQLNLDGLSTPQIPSHFKGFFNNINDLKNAVPNPILHQDWAYVKNASTGGILAYRSDNQGTTRLWSVVAPLGSIAVIDRNSAPVTYRQAFGIEKDNAWTLDDKGILTLKKVNTKTKVEIVDSDSNVETGEFNTIQFMSGKSYATIQGDKLFLNHPQRVIQYNSTFERSHASRDYEGNIFYDENSRAWMGWAIPQAAGGVDRKWTKIAHEGMSDEVKDLSKRIPAKASSIEVGLTEDSPSWSYNGLTFLDKDSSSLPEEFRSRCGGYITTSVQDKDQPGVTIPQYRMQTCVADEEGGATYARRLNATGSPGAAMTWTPWVRTSFSKKDINAHEQDPGGHKTTIKYHRVTSFSSKLTALSTQQGPDGTTGFVRDSNCGLLTDNYGFGGGSDCIVVPYDGNFRIKGEFAFSGYDGETIPVTTWTVILMIERKNQPGAYSLLQSYDYHHSKVNTKYPPLFFEKNQTGVEVGDRIYIKIKSSDSKAIIAAQPALYFVPLKSYFVVEDVDTRAGTFIASTHRSQLANLNAFGDVEVKAHTRKYLETGGVRVYGEKVIKTPKEMTSN